MNEKNLVLLKEIVVKEMYIDAKNGDKVAKYFVKGIEDQNSIVMEELAEYIVNMCVELSK